MTESKSGLIAIHAAGSGEPVTSERISEVQAVVALGVAHRARAAKQAPVTASNPLDAWRAEYERSPALQSEFLKLEIYQAFRQGVASGRVSLHQGRVIASGKPGVSMLGGPVRE